MLLVHAVLVCVSCACTCPCPDVFGKRPPPQAGNDDDEEDEDDDEEEAVYSGNFLIALPHQYIIITGTRCLLECRGHSAGFPFWWRNCW